MVINREKVIRQWEGIIDQIEQGNLRRPITTTLIYDTFAMLKEQEPVKQEPVEPFHICINGEKLRTLITNRYFIFCPYCGRRIKWND